MCIAGPVRMNAWTRSGFFFSFFWCRSASEIASGEKRTGRLEL